MAEAELLQANPMMVKVKDGFELKRLTNGMRKPPDHPPLTTDRNPLVSSNTTDTGARLTIKGTHKNWKWLDRSPVNKHAKEHKNPDRELGFTTTNMPVERDRSSRKKHESPDRERSLKTTNMPVERDRSLRKKHESPDRERSFTTTNMPVERDRSSRKELESPDRERSFTTTNMPVESDRSSGKKLENPDRERSFTTTNMQEESDRSSGRKKLESPDRERSFTTTNMPVERDRSSRKEHESPNRELSFTTANIPVESDRSSGKKHKEEHENAGREHSFETTNVPEKRDSSSGKKHESPDRERSFTPTNMPVERDRSSGKKHMKEHDNLYRERSFTPTNMPAERARSKNHLKQKAEKEGNLAAANAALTKAWIKYNETIVEVQQQSKREDQRQRYAQRHQATNLEKSAEKEHKNPKLTAALKTFEEAKGHLSQLAREVNELKKSLKALGKGGHDDINQKVQTAKESLQELKTDFTYAKKELQDQKELFRQERIWLKGKLGSKGLVGEVEDSTDHENDNLVIVMYDRKGQEREVTLEKKSSYFDEIYRRKEKIWKLEEKCKKMERLIKDKEDDIVVLKEKLKFGKPLTPKARQITERLYGGSSQTVSVSEITRRPAKDETTIKMREPFGGSQLIPLSSKAKEVTERLYQTQSCHGREFLKKRDGHGCSPSNSRSSHWSRKDDIKHEISGQILKKNIKKRFKGKRQARAKEAKEIAERLYWP